MQDDHLCWWIDSRTTIHVCMSKQLFKTLHKVVDGEYLYMGNNASTKATTNRQVELLFTLGNLLVLTDVSYAPDISRNLVAVHFLIDWEA